MRLSVGERLGPYEIVALIGEGGMGEVYRARDTKLDRDVAIKVLPHLLAQNPERLARFEREAKVLAALNHQNIAAIYGLEDRGIVMELVEGETLKGPLPLETALEYAMQIAGALEAAHEKGVVHRDLKPANVKVREDGTVKVLDFGLAQLNPDPSPDREGGDSTLTMGATEAGAILGTAAYMAPEQARGQKVDKRADIWAFGVVLHEMLTGKRLFHGATASDVLAQVLTKEPDLDRVPVKVRRLLGRCFEKDPKRRLRDVGEARFLLQEEVPQPATRSPAPQWGWAAVGVLVLALAAVSFLHFREAPEPKQLVRLDVDLGPGVSLGSQAGADAILSPDGNRLVYVAQGRLFTRRLDQPKAAELAGTEGAYAPFFSPDGKWVAFFIPGKLKKVSVEGGAPVVLCDAGPSAQGGSWSEDGNIVAALGLTLSLSRIPASGGTPTALTELAQGEVTHRWPQVLPGGKAVLFTSNATSSGFGGASIEVISLVDHRRKALQRGATYGRFLPGGYLIYVSRGTLFAVPFDSDRLEVRGTPVPVLEEVAYSTIFGSAQFDFSRSGTLVYRSGTAGGGLVTVQWLDAAGKTQPLLEKPGFYLRPRLSPDGQRLALGMTEGSSEDIWVYEGQRDTMTRLTFGGAANIVPTWSPDGRYIVFRAGTGMIFWTRSDGAGKPQLLIQTKNLETPHSFTPDGKRLAFFESGAGTGTTFDLWTVRVESDGAGLRAGTPEVLLQTPADERYPSFSPDGRWLAYTSDESGIYQVYVRAFPDKGGKWQVSNGGGVYPVWSRNGRELFFRSPDNRIMVAGYRVSGDSFLIDKPRLWSEKRLADFGRIGVSTYDVAPDGKRIVALMPAEVAGEQQSPNHVTFLLNFFDEVRRRTTEARGK